MSFYETHAEQLRYKAISTIIRQNKTWIVKYVQILVSINSSWPSDA